MAWEAAPGTQVSSSASVTGTTYGDSSTVIHLNPGESSVILVESDPPATPTDDLVVGVFVSHDGGTTWSTDPVMAFTVDNGTDPLYKMFSFTGYPTFKLMYKLTDTTDTFTVDAWVRKDGISI